MLQSILHATFLSTFIAMSLATTSPSFAKQQLLFVGTNAAEQGIYASTLDLETGEFGPIEAVGDAPRPGFLALHPKLPLLYAVTAESKRPSGGLRAFQIHFNATSKEPLLTLLNQQSTGDDGATHLAIDPSANTILVANYSGGSTACVPLNKAGLLQPMTALIKHQGQGSDPKRQAKPYAHGIAIHAQGQFACVADLGTDEVIVYQLLADGKLKRESAWKSAPGAGPRHLAFHPNQSWLYSINELDSTLSVLIFDQQTGKLTELQTVDTLPADYNKPNTTAEVVVHPNGRFVYCSNRGHDSTAVFAINQQTGQLTKVQIEPTQGGHPRFIGIEPSGHYLIAANRDANNLVSFRIDQETGKLKPTGHQVNIRQPVCVVFPQQTHALQEETLGEGK